MIHQNNNLQLLIEALGLEDIDLANPHNYDLINQLSIQVIADNNGILSIIPPFEKHPYLEEIDCSITKGLMIGTFPPISYLCDQLGLANLTFNGIISPPDLPYFPMTALDTFAAITFSERHYCDNANVNYVELPEINNVNLFALASIINSTVYSVLARSIANPQSNGYFKFNKQFLEPVPFPGVNFREREDLKTQLFDISRRIEGLQIRYKSSSPNQKRAIKTLLQRQWDLLDEVCYQLYGLNDEEKAFFNERGRNIDRIEILNNN